MDEHNAEGTEPRLKHSVSHLLHRAQQFASDCFVDASKDPELTLRQFAILAALDDKDGRSQTELVQVTGIDRSTLAEMVKRMVDKKLLQADQCGKDKRAKSVKLTPEGRQKLASIGPKVARADLAILGALPATKQRAFIAALQMLASAADRALQADTIERQRKKDAKKRERETAKATKRERRKAGKRKKDGDKKDGDGESKRHRALRVARVDAASPRQDSSARQAGKPGKDGKKKLRRAVAPAG